MGAREKSRTANTAGKSLFLYLDIGLDGDPGHTPGQYSIHDGTPD